MKLSCPRARSRRGFTLLETVVSLGVFLVLSYALVVTLDMASDSQSAVTERASIVRASRSAQSDFAQELREAQDADVQITVLPDGNHSVSLRQPIEVGGAAAWGVFDWSLGATDIERTRADWRIRYTVVALDVNGAIVRRLVRQLVDVDGVVQAQRLVLDGVASGFAARPGFQVTRDGDVWRVRITPEQHGSAKARYEDFHVTARN